jgi:ABC-type sugar transport system substrate-binding protein
MAKPLQLVAPPQEALEARGTTTARAMRATHPRVATMNKRYNNPLTTSVVQGIKAKMHSRLAFTMPP